MLCYKRYLCVAYHQERSFFEFKGDISWSKIPDRYNKCYFPHEELSTINKYSVCGGKPKKFYVK